MAAVRSAVLKHLRVRASLPPLHVSAISISRVFGRFFSEEVKGSFLDKSEVTDRVVTVVKNFQKVEPSKDLNMQLMEISALHLKLVYHVPRWFFKEGEPNTLILFEEAGGEPFNVNFQTVAVGTICGHVEEGKTLTCDSQIALDAIQKACVGKMACSIEGSARVLGDSKCKNMPVSLAVQAVCS